ncbi:hypothetical protein Tco_0429879, partial [Tanacetum coccineum]
CQNGLTKDEIFMEMMSVHISSGLVLHQMMSVHISSGLVLHQMMSDHNSSDLVPQRKMASVENNTSGSVPECPVPQCSNDVCSHQFRPRSSSNDF